VFLRSDYVTYRTRVACQLHWPLFGRGLRTWLHRDISGGKSAAPVFRGALIFCLFFTASQLAYGDSDIEFLLFPQIGGTHRSGLDPGTRLKHNDPKAGVDIFFTVDRGRLRLLGEYLWSDDMHDMERLQVGWKLDSGTTLWLGRHHAPLGYWNTQYHHGVYLQTSISRPEIVEYDDDGGPLPSHVTGLLLEGLEAKNEHGWRYAVSLGAGPELDKTLEPLDILAPDKGSHKLSATARLSYLPDAYGSNEAGVFISYSRIPGVGASLNEVKQNVYGAFADWRWGEIRTLGAVFRLDNRLDQSTGNTTSSFNSAYLQVEYDWQAKWTLYGRTENSAGEENNAYLALLPNFIKARNLAGVRYDITRRQSLKLEISRNHLGTDRYNQITVQWSAVFP